jgi:hypothetical protein
MRITEITRRPRSTGKNPNFQPAQVDQRSDSADTPQVMPFLSSHASQRL